MTILDIAAVIYPLYQVGQTYERHFVWDPPVIPVPNGVDRIPPDDLDRLMKDPRQRKIINGMNAMPGEVALSPIWVGRKTRPGRNWVGMTAVFATILYAGWLFHRFRR